MAHLSCVWLPHIGFLPLARILIQIFDTVRRARATILLHCSFHISPNTNSLCLHERLSFFKAASVPSLMPESKFPPFYDPLTSCVLRLSALSSMTTYGGQLVPQEQMLYVCSLWSLSSS
jgi:hypothetical protein